MEIIKNLKIKKSLNLSANLETLKPALPALSAISIVSLIILSSVFITPAAHAQSVNVVKCEKDGVVSYQAVAPGADKSCSKVSIAVDNINNQARSVRSGSGNNGNNSVNYASRDTTNGSATSSISNQTQKNRDIRRFELLAQELLNEQEALKGVEAQLAKSTESAELKKLSDQKIVVQSNISALKKELGKNDAPMVAAIKAAPVSAVAITPEAPKITPSNEDKPVLQNVASTIKSPSDNLTNSTNENKAAPAPLSASAAAKALASLTTQLTQSPISTTQVPSTVQVVPAVLPQPTPVKDKISSVNKSDKETNDLVKGFFAK